MSGQQYDLKPLWVELLNIYRAVAKVCDEKNLRYYGLGGTALGCLRHKGFIPWDDDFDICMPRHDYRKFFDIVSKRLPPNLSCEDFLSPTHRYGFHEMFGKVYETRPEVIDRVMSASNLQLEQGVFIDIFPIDGYPGNWLAKRWWMFRKTIWRCLTGFGNQPKCVRPIIPIFKRLYGLGSSRVENARKFEQWLTKWDFDSAPLVADYNMPWRRAKKFSLTKQDFEPSIRLPFENTEIAMPHNAELYVTSVFNNWRALPPEKSRHPTHQVCH